MLYKIGLKFLRNRFWLNITWKNEQKILIRQFSICPGQCTSGRREYELSLCPIKEGGFWKKSLTKVMEIFNNYYAEDSSRGMCTVQKNILMTFQYFYVFLYETFSSIFVLGLILVQTAVLAKDKIVSLNTGNLIWFLNPYCQIFSIV